MVAEPQQDKKKIVPEFRPGDTVRVHMRVVEGDSERVQIFEGTVITRRGSGTAQTFTVRKISFGVGVERTFPLFSPHIDKIEVVKSGKVRRARLYYLRALTGKAAKIDEHDRQPGAPAPAVEAPKAEETGGGKPSADHHQAKAKPAEHRKAAKSEPGAAMGAVAPK